MKWNSQLVYIQPWYRRINYSISHKLNWNNKVNVAIYRRCSLRRKIGNMACQYPGRVKNKWFNSPIFILVWEKKYFCEEPSPLQAKLFSELVKYVTMCGQGGKINVKYWYLEITVVTRKVICYSYTAPSIFCLSLCTKLKQQKRNISRH